MIRSRHLRSLVARLLAMLFAVQMVVSGLCLLAPQVHAVSHMEISSNMGFAAQLGGEPVLGGESVCMVADGVQGELQEGGHADGSAGCFHCVSPDLAKHLSAESPLQLQITQLLAVVVVAGDTPVAPAVNWSLRDPAGDSHGSHHLLFHLVPRILV
ncbi:MAG: hypothetical protein Q9M13_07545 [Mariprofundales bacterium]|nr:hypothetical protein [Mariprofundales bacterium]